MELLKTMRHEFKYVMPLSETYNLRNKLDEILTLDRGGSYLVRSMYFDTYDDHDYYAKQDGDITRHKIRLRIYSSDAKTAKLEIKAKEDIHQVKESLIITKEEAIEMTKGNYEFLNNYEGEFKEKVYRLLKDHNYVPKVIIEYDRIAYITTTTTRITFDYNVRRSHDFDKFFTDDINYFNVSDGKDILLEVKFDRFLEPYIGKVINKYVTRNQSVSKYIMGRNI